MGVQNRSSIVLLIELVIFAHMVITNTRLVAKVVNFAQKMATVQAYTKEFKQREDTMLI